MFCARSQKDDAIITQDLTKRKNFRGLGFLSENRSAESCIYNRRREVFWVAGIKCTHGGGHYNIVSWRLSRVNKADIKPWIGTIRLKYFGLANKDVGPELPFSGFFSNGNVPERRPSRILSGFDSSAGISHLEKCDGSKPASSQSEGRGGNEKQPSVRDKISSELHRFTIQFGLFILSLNLVLGPLWGYSFYYQRRLLCASIVGIELLLYGFALLWLL
jgi:hypothetical protein